MQVGAQSLMQNESFIYYPGDNEVSTIQTGNIGSVINDVNNIYHNIYINFRNHKEGVRKTLIQVHW